MAAMGKAVPPEVVEVRRKTDRILREKKFKSIDAASATTGKDYLLKLWMLAVASPVGIAIVHDGIKPQTMANVFYELGLLHAYGKETVVIRIGNVELPSDLVRTEYIPYDRSFSSQLRNFIDSLSARADYYLTLANNLENNPLLAIDYLRRSYLLSGDASLKEQAKRIYNRSGLRDRAKGSVERLLLEF